MSALLDTQPWKEIQPSRSLMKPKGMVGPRERACYYWFAKNHLSKDGFIVDAGSFLGAATYCFANGAAEAGHGRRNERALIHSYDYFKVIDEYVGETIRQEFRPIEHGESYLDIFQSQTAEFSDLIETYPGDFLSNTWSGGPIDLLFIDIAKTIDLNAHAVGQFFGSLVPGKSIVLHQDYFHCWHPYIHYSMEYFDEEFELVDEHVPHQTRVWRLSAPISEEKRARIANMDLSKEERLALLDRLIAKSSEAARPMNEVVKIWQLCLDKDWDMAAATIADFKERRLPEGRSVLWAKQVLQIENHVMRALQ